MTLEEAVYTVDWIERLYWRKKDDEARKDLIKLWAVIFVDYEAEVVKYAVTQFIKHDRNGYPPMPGQVMGEIEKLEDELSFTNRILKQNGRKKTTLAHIVRSKLKDEHRRYLPKGDGYD